VPADPHVEQVAALRTDKIDEPRMVYNESSRAFSTNRARPKIPIPDDAGDQFGIIGFVAHRSPWPAKKD